MTPDELTTALQEMSPGRIAEQNALAGRVLEQVGELPTRATELVASDDRAVAGNARDLVGALEELAVRAVLGASPAATTTEAAWRVRTAAAAAIALRARVAGHLRSLLHDHRLVPLPAGLEGLAHAPPARMCDEAYVALRELINLDESRSAFTLDRRAFLRQSDQEKDAEIESVIAGQPFRRLVDDLGV